MKKSPLIKLSLLCISLFMITACAPAPSSTPTKKTAVTKTMTTKKVQSTRASVSGGKITKFCRTYKPKGEVFDGKKYCDPVYFSDVADKRERACNREISNEITHNEDKRASNCNYCAMFKNCMNGRPLLSNVR